jgi:hypothetical protein
VSAGEANALEGIVTTHTLFGMGVIDTCPECQSHDLCAVHDGRGTNIFCNSCAACWSMSLGWVRRVNPSSCPGCSRRSECLARQTAEAQSLVRPSADETPRPVGEEASK